eukprot:scaffold2478_cov270-Pinguiococcus_pyrenoidosus.AAC.7
MKVALTACWIWRHVWPHRSAAPSDTRWKCTPRSSTSLRMAPSTPRYKCTTGRLVPSSAAKPSRYVSTRTTNMLRMLSSSNDTASASSSGGAAPAFRQKSEASAPGVSIWRQDCFAPARHRTCGMPLSTAEHSSGSSHSLGRKS